MPNNFEHLDYDNLPEHLSKEPTVSYLDLSYYNSYKELFDLFDLLDEKTEIKFTEVIDNTRNLFFFTKDLKGNLALKKTSKELFISFNDDPFGGGNTSDYGKRNNSDPISNLEASDIIMHSKSKEKCLLIQAMSTMSVKYIRGNKYPVAAYYVLSPVDGLVLSNDECDK